ncbi:hypothetical protein Tter_2820 [Thermobaculum terrenum ATCC BAA-798]|uniref:DUF4386 family protein n=1 Tax=Thermobaculum terrenum (strain ATCC BAA-798 / CCMEE 7001 / YNP1) TaxID=525904 RepID=D1CIY4_THET1|nr:hypothetical protein [Thermobaculum terrenum]ACZ43704.1 hypothetical protein Tter_2820 [Thermobaculum terrenum ATCC BAA-798]
MPPRWARWAAGCGTAYALLLFVGSILERAGPRQEPSLQATAVQIAFFYASLSKLSTLGSYLSLLSYLLFPPFLAGLWHAYRQEPPPRTALLWVGMASALVATCIHLVGEAAWVTAAVVARSERGIQVEVARTLLWEAYLLWATSWPLYGLFTGALALLMLGERGASRLLGAVGALVALLLIASRLTFPSKAGVIAFDLYLGWVAVVGLAICLGGILQPKGKESAIE